MERRYVLHVSISHPDLGAWSGFGLIMEQLVGWWVVSSYLGDALTGGCVARESFRLSAGAAITTKVQKVLKVPCEGRRSKVRKQSLA